MGAGRQEPPAHMRALRTGDVRELRWRREGDQSAVCLVGRPPALDIAEGSERVRIICGPLLGGQPHDRMIDVRIRSPMARSR